MGGRLVISVSICGVRGWRRALTCYKRRSAYTGEALSDAIRFAEEWNSDWKARAIPKKAAALRCALAAWRGCGVAPDDAPLLRKLGFPGFRREPPATAVKGCAPGSVSVSERGMEEDDGLADMRVQIRIDREGDLTFKADCFTTGDYVDPEVAAGLPVIEGDALAVAVMRAELGVEMDLEDLVQIRNACAMSLATNQWGFKSEGGIPFIMSTGGDD